MFDRNMKSSVFNILEDVSEAKFPGFNKAIWWECTQERGEIIFVPSGWYHQVHNLEGTISINHNWFNAYNLSWLWNLLLRDYAEAKEYIEDIKDICDDFEGLCQRNLAANTGMNFCDFFVFMVHFSFANLVQFSHLAKNDKNFIWTSIQIARHVVFNLESLRNIALKMKSRSLVENWSNSIDFRKTLEDHTFMGLCQVLGRTYGMIHEQCEVSYDIKPALVDDLDLEFIETSGLHVYSPEDLVKFIDSAFTKLMGGSAANKVLLADLDILGS
ncbi:unnamed protein product [Ilex paraguariensis]|uniref:JmjC domain-containing protein n=1 Tax=Ilex paraguariensis TaxID=185542 RepID=A0ABC8R0R8_9AQUA